MQLTSDINLVQEDELQLIGKVQAGNFDALEMLYERYSRNAYGLALRVLNNSEAAEDIVQDVFIRFWKQPYSYDPARGRFITWLLSVVRNASIDQLRRKSNHSISIDTAELNGQLDQVVEQRPSVEEEVWLSIQRTKIREALSSLPFEQGQLVDMAFFKGMTHQEIAVATGLPLGTVKSRIRQGLLKLKNLLVQVELVAEK